MTLCSGIGAPELAASWLGWRHIMTCEINPFCRRVLEYHYPEAYHHYDIKTLNYETIEKELSSRFGNWREGGTVLVAGFPCQPFSCAGKRLGAEDDRYLWDEVKRILAEVKPDWFIGENVAGILSMVLPGSEVKVASYEDIAGESYEEVEVRQQSVVERICLDLESIGYSVVPFVIPACAVGAPHRRDRVWIVARRIAADTSRNGDSGRPGAVREEVGRQDYELRAEPFEHGGLQTMAAPDPDEHRSTPRTACKGTERSRRTELAQPEEWGNPPQRDNGLHGLQRFTSNAKCSRGSEIHNQIQSKQPDGSGFVGVGGERDASHPARERQQRAMPRYSILPAEQFSNFPTQSPVCSRDDGLSLGLSGITFPRWRTESIKALGNSMVPQVVYELFKAIEHEQNTTQNRQG